MKVDDRAHLDDILTSIEAIETYTRGKSFVQFSKDQKDQDAVLRRFGIIGEAAHRLSRARMAQMTEIRWKEIVGMRNKIIHDYGDVDLKMVWKTIREDLKELKKAIEQSLVKDCEK